MGENYGDRWVGAILRVKETGNVAEACRRFQVNRNSFLKMKKRFEVEGEEVFRASLRHEGALLSGQDRDRLLIEAIANPFQSNAGLTRMLATMGTTVSISTVQRYLKSAGLGNQEDRVAALEYFLSEVDHPKRREMLKNFNDAVIAKLERGNARVEEVGRRLKELGIFAVGFTFLVTVAGRKLYLFAAVDMYSTYTYLEISTSIRQSEKIEFLNRADGFFRNSGIVPQFFFPLSYNRKDYNIDPRLSEIPPYVTQLMREMRQAYSLSAIRKDSVEVVSGFFEEWWGEYNLIRRNGYPTCGLSPLEMVARFNDPSMQQEWRFM